MKLSGDSQIVSNVLQGNVNAYGLLVRKYQKSIYNLMYRVTGSEELAVEMTQETFIRAYEKLECFDPGKRFFPWLYTIGLNFARDHLRRSGREASRFVRTWNENFAADQRENPDARLEQKMVMVDVLRALGRLPFEYREAIFLRFREELSLKEVAQALSISVSAAKMRIHRGLKALRSELERTSNPGSG